MRGDLQKAKEKEKGKGNKKNGVTPNKKAGKELMTP